MRRARATQFFTDYADQSEPAEGERPELVIPGDLSTLPDAELGALHEQAVAEFDALYGDGTGLAADDLAALGQLTEGIESIQTELQTRDAAQSERNELAQSLAQRIGMSADTEQDMPEGEAPADGEAPVAEDENPTEDDGAAETVAAAASPATPPRDIRVNLSGRSRRLPAVANTGNPRTMRDVVLASDGGAGLDWQGIGQAIDRRLTAFNLSQYRSAKAAGRHIREQHGVAVIHKPFAEGMVLRSSDPAHVDEVLANARNEHRLPGGSLVASGGWCAPSETLYDLFEIESRDGLVSVPEVGISRGGINFTPGPDFASIYNGTGFHYTEAEDEAGDYDGAGAGSKPCMTVACPPFTEARLDVDGLCLSAGLLQQRGYPEAVARTSRGALIAHDHKVSGGVIGGMVAGSTAVTMVPDQAGAVAPLLEAIELQVEHYRYVHRMSRSATLEAIFPYWIRGALRADLSRRQGVDLLDVPDSRVDAWFRQRGIAPQYVYNWQDLAGAASTFLTWPNTVTFLLYAAGTWVKGGSDVITLDTIYDSVMLGTNDYTALWTEEGWLVAKLGHDSRVITVDICPSGATHFGLDIDCDGQGSPVGP